MPITTLSLTNNFLAIPTPPLTMSAPSATELDWVSLLNVTTPVEVINGVVNSN